MVGLRYELTDIKLDQRGLYSLLHSQRGPVAEHIRSVGRQTVIQAKLLAGVRIEPAGKIVVGKGSGASASAPPG